MLQQEEEGERGVVEASLSRMDALHQQFICHLFTFYSVNACIYYSQFASRSHSRSGNCLHSPFV
jgi:hypothetical protein